MKKVIAILEPKKVLTTVELHTLYHHKIDEIIRNPYIYIIISDSFLFAAKYIHKTGFRNCTIYHIGDKPKHAIGGFKTKGGFTSTIELEEALKQDSVQLL